MAISQEPYIKYTYICAGAGTSFPCMYICKKALLCNRLLWYMEMCLCVCRHLHIFKRTYMCLHAILCMYACMYKFYIFTYASVCVYVGFRLRGSHYGQVGQHPLPTPVHQANLLRNSCSKLSPRARGIAPCWGARAVSTGGCGDICKSIGTCLAGGFCRPRNEVFPHGRSAGALEK